MSVTKYEVITNDVSDYINLFVRITHIICNRPLYWVMPFQLQRLCGCERRCGYDY